MKIKDYLSKNLERCKEEKCSVGFAFLSRNTQWHEIIRISSVQFSRSVVSDSLCPYGLHHSRFPHPSPTPRACSNSYPLSWWCHPTILSSKSPSPPTFNLSQHQGLLKWVSSSHQMAKLLELQFQHQSFQRTFRTACL